MAATLWNVCLAFPAISAAADGYKVYALMDASGSWSAFSKDIVLARLTQAGVIPTDVIALVSELQQNLGASRSATICRNSCFQDAQLQTVD